MKEFSTSRRNVIKHKMQKIEEVEILSVKYYKRMIKIILLILLVVVILIIIVTLIYLLLIKEKKHSKKYSMHIYFNLNNKSSEEIDNNSYSDTIRKTNIIKECPIAFYLTRDNKGNQICKACSINNCEICQENENNDICKSCISPFVPIYVNNIISNCEKSCEIGEGSKCSICNGKTNKCSACNKGYKLKDGICILDITNVSYSFKAVYKTSKKNEKIELIHNNFTEKIIEMKVEDTIISPASNYLFSEIGNHTIYYLMDNDITSLAKMFIYNKNIISISFTPLMNTEGVVDINNMFYNCHNLNSADLFYLDTKNVKYMEGLFFSCFNLKSVNLTNFNTEKVLYMGSMFSNCFSLTSIDVSHFNTKNTKKMSFMFSECYKLTSIDVSNFNTENVLTLSGLFHSCNSLKTINVLNFNTKNLENMYEMFSNCTSLTSINLSNFRTDNVVEMERMFADCSKLSYIDISNFKYNESIYENSDLFVGLPSSGSLIINKNYYDKIANQVPKGWKITFK